MTARHDYKPTLVGTRLRERRKERQLSQRGLAQRVGTSSSYISNIEGGGVDVSVWMLARLAIALELDAADVLQQHFQDLVDRRELPFKVSVCPA